MAESLRVLVVAESLLVRSGLAALLDMQSVLEVVGQLDTQTLSIADFEVYEPDVIVYDYTDDQHLEVFSGLPVVILLANLEDAPQVIAILTEAANVEQDAGYGYGYGVLLRDTPPEMIAAALHSVAFGLVTLDPLIAPAVVTFDALPLETLPEPLTARETEVLQLLAEGLPNKLIAQRLNISANTVKFHINAILSKLDVQSRTEAVVRATRLGLVIL